MLAQHLADRLLAVVARAHLLLAGERAQTLAEYGLILTLIAVGVAVPTMLIFRTTMVDAYNSTINCLGGSC